MKKIGNIYQEYKTAACEGILDYYSEHPELVGVASHHVMSECCFIYEPCKLGVLLVIDLVDGKKVTVDEPKLLTAFSSIHNQSFTKLFLDLPNDLVFFVSSEMV